MSPEEVIPMFHPQIYDVSNPALTDEEFPELEQLSRYSLGSDRIYICYNAQILGLFVGR